MFKFKRLGAALMAVMAIASMTTTAFAADTTLQADGTAQGDMEIVGTIEALNMIDVTLPVNGLQFVIKADRTIDWVDAEIINNSAAPLNVTMISAGEAVLSTEEEAAGYNAEGAPALVADDKFDDWNNLTKSQTKANIAISVNGENISDVANTPVSLGSLASAYGEDANGDFEAVPQTLAVTGSALYGKAWDNTSDMLLKYDTVLEFSMPD